MVKLWPRGAKFMAICGFGPQVVRGTQVFFKANRLLVNARAFKLVCNFVSPLSLGRLRSYRPPTCLCYKRFERPNHAKYTINFFFALIAFNIIIMIAQIKYQNLTIKITKRL